MRVKLVIACAALVMGLAGGFFIASTRASDNAVSPVSEARLRDLVGGGCTLARADLSFVIPVLERVTDEPATDGPDLRIDSAGEAPCVFTFALGDDSFWQGKGLIRRDAPNRMRVMLFSRFDRSLQAWDRPSATIDIVFDGDRTFVTDTRSGRIFTGSKRDVATLKAIGSD